MSEPQAVGNQIVFGLAEWTQWLDCAAKRILGISGDDFERQYCAGTLQDSGEAQDLAAVIPLIQRLRKRA